MKLHLAELPKLIIQRRSTAIFGVLIISMLWCGIGLKYYDVFRGDLSDAERSSKNFAMVFEENVLRSISEIDKSLQYLRRTVENRDDATDFHTIVSTADLLSEIIVQVAIIDAKGMMRASNASKRPAAPLDLSDREHYRVHLNSTEDKLFISKPVIGRASGKWSVQLTRRFLDADGRFAGVVVTSLDPAHLTNFYNNIDFGISASIALIGADGVVRASGGSADGFTLGQDLNKTEMARHMLGDTTTVESNDGEPSLVTVRKVRGHPLWVTVSQKKAEIYQSSWWDLRINVIVGLLFTLIMLIAIEQILRTEARARKKSQQLKLTLENMSQGIMLVTKDLQIPIINSRCCELLNLPREFVNTPPRFDELVSYQTQLDAARKIAGPAGDWPADEETLNAVDNHITISERQMSNGRVIEVRNGHLPDGSFIQTFADITKRRQAESHVARLAAEDPLTGLPNRRVFRSTLEEICKRAEGNPADKFAVMFIDLDRFKVINDTLGHRIGDLLLQAVARRLRGELPKESILARLGGDEFAIIVPAFDSSSEIEILAKGIIQTVAQPFNIDGYQMCSSISVGIATGPQDGAKVDELLVAADLALYAVKAESRGTFKFYDKAMNVDLNHRRQIEMDLREAIARSELELYYQPIIKLDGDVVIGFEALARWRHPVNGMVPPGVFIPVAEDTGLILAIGEWALAEACRTAVQWPNDLKISVNLSPVQFLDPNLLEKIQQVLAETGLAPHRLELEITERIFLENSARIISILGQLKKLGVRISLDDFGTGYSSLSYLRSFPFNKIKIDRTFVADLAMGSEHVVIIQSVVNIAHALNMTITAEGVEFAHQHEFLSALGYDEAQGYFFSEAVPFEKVPDLIAYWSKTAQSRPSCLVEARSA